MLKSSILVGLCAGLLLSPAAAPATESVAQAKPWPTPEWEALVKAAQQEGKVELILSGQVPQRLRPILPQFEKKYGVKVNFQTGGGSAHAERILAERRIGRFTLDVWLGGANTALVSLLPNKALVSFPELLIDPEVNDKSKWFQGKHHYTDLDSRYIFTWGASPAYNIAYNTKQVDPNEIRSYADVLNPKWNGKIVSWSPAAQGTGASSVPMWLNPKIGETWFRRWANEMNVTIVTDARQGAEWVAIGRFAIGMFGLNTQAEALKDQGFPIKDFLPHPLAEGTVLSASAGNIMVMDRAPNRHAAQLFVNWALSREGQQLFIQASDKGDSLRTDVDNSVLEPQYRIDPKVEYIVAFSNREYIDRQDDILLQLKKIMQDAGYK